MQVVHCEPVVLVVTAFADVLFLKRRGQTRALFRVMCHSKLTRHTVK
ncbi:MAG: hypothetical protein RIR21_587 [Pseudomonadota bacterium]|jgi:hypothetical protein